MNTNLSFLNTNLYVYQQFSAEIYKAIWSGENQLDKLKGLDQEDRSIVLIALNNMRFVDNPDNINQILSVDKERVVKRLKTVPSHRGSSGFFRRLIKFIQNFFGRIFSSTLTTTYNEVKSGSGNISSLIKSKEMERVTTEKTLAQEGLTVQLRRTLEIKFYQLIDHISCLQGIRSVLEPLNANFDDLKKLVEDTEKLERYRSWNNFVREAYGYGAYALEKIIEIGLPETISQITGMLNDRELVGAYNKANNTVLGDDMIRLIYLELYQLLELRNPISGVAEKQREFAELAKGFKNLDITLDESKF